MNFNNVYTYLVQSSSLVPLGGRVLDEADYETVGQKAVELLDAYVADGVSAAGLRIDIEFKKTADEGIVFKQVRQLPAPSSDTKPMFLVDDGAPLCVFQGESGELFANHRLKLEMNPQYRSIRLSDQTLGAPLFTEFDWSYMRDGEVQESNFDPTTTQGAVNSFEPQGGAAALYQQSFRLEENGPLLTLSMSLPYDNSSFRVPLMSLSETWVYLSAAYASPMIQSEYGGGLTTTEMDYVAVRACGNRPSGAQHRTLDIEAEGTTVQINMYYPNAAEGAVGAGYTAWLTEWDDITITGITTQALVLTSDWSKSFRPEHHNFNEHFLFEPRRDHNVSASQKAELEAANIELIYVWDDPYDDDLDQIILIAPDGSIVTP